ncbi:NWD2 protein, partial [Rhypophila decipiens]
MTNQVVSLHAAGQARVQVGNNYYGSSDFLPTADDAAFDSHAEEHNARCHRDTRTELLCQIREWAYDPHGETIFWLNGMAGTGKSTISRTVAKAFADDGILGASFFFKRGEGDRGKATLLFPTIARQLVYKIPTLEAFVREAIDASPDVAKKALKDQFEKLILQPLGRVHHVIAITIVIDALDECDGDNDVKAIISVLAQAKELRSSRLRIFITSRPELPIRLGFSNVQGKYQDLALHQIPEPIVERDIFAFLGHELAGIRVDYNSQALEGQELPPDWPDEHVIRTLTQMAVPLFIFAATVCRFLHNKGRTDPIERLKTVLEYRTATHNSRLDKLDTTYLPVLNQLTFEVPDQDKADLLAEFRDVVGPIVLLAQPLSVRSLAQLLDIEVKNIHGQLNSLHSVLSIPRTLDAPVKLFHLSFRDFLVDPTKRAKEFWIDETQYHRTLADRCIQLLRQRLGRDICGLQIPGKLRSEVDQQTIDAALPPVAQYACQYWVHHLKESKSSVRDGGPVHRFLTSHLLHWLEALSLLGRISESLGMADDLLALSSADDIEISRFLHDIRRFIRNNRSIIDIAPLQLYASALVFSPARSITR